MPPKEIRNCQHNDLGCHSYPKSTKLVTSNFGLQETTIRDKFSHSGTVSLSQAPSVVHDREQRSLLQKYHDGGGGYSCREPCHTSQVDRKQISPSVEECPHHLTKGYCGVEKLSILVTKAVCF